MIFGSMFNRWPYTDLQNLNLDWLIGVCKDISTNLPPKFEEIENEINKKLDKALNEGTLGDILTNTGNGTSEWKPFDTVISNQIIQAVNNWLNNHPEATTTVTDNSITINKINDRLKLNIEKTAITTMHMLPYFSYRHFSNLYMYQSACEYKIENDTYLALGVFINDIDTSGIMLFKNGIFFTDAYGTDYGHVNSITFCPEDNKLYVGATSSQGLSYDSYKLDATDLSNKENIGLSTGIIQWYDGYFYTWATPYVSRRKYNETTWTPIYTIDTEGYTVQSFIILNNYCYFSLLIPDTDPYVYNYGELYIKIYSPENTLIGNISINTLYEPEQMYVYNNIPYILINEQCYDENTHSVYPRASIMKLESTDTPINVVRNINHDKIFFRNINGYGNGSEQSPTSSPLACLLSFKTFIDIGSDSFLPMRANIISNKEIIGTGSGMERPKVSFIGARDNHMRFNKVIITGYDAQDIVLDNAKISFDECSFDLTNIITNNVHFILHDTDMTIFRPLFNAEFNTSTQIANIVSDQTTSGNITIIPSDINSSFNIKNGIISNNSVANTMFSPKCRIFIHASTRNITDDIIKSFTNITMIPVIDPINRETGTYDLNKMVIPGQISFNSNSTVLNQPEGLTGRRSLDVKQFGSTAGKLQIIYDETGKVYMRTITGTNTMSYDSEGTVVTNYTFSEWIALHE